jgi:hypothetical protein
MTIEEQLVHPTKNREAVAYFTPSAFCFVSGYITHYKNINPSGLFFCDCRI